MPRGHTSAIEPAEIASRPATKANEAMHPRVMSEEAFTSGLLRSAAFYSDDTVLVLNMDVRDGVALLAKAGVSVTLVGNAEGGSVDAFTARNVRYEAGNAVAYGMEYDAALRAVTLTPAEIFGVADQVGSLAAGKRADVVIWSGDPFEFSSRAEHVFVNGVQSTTRTREDLLESRYKTLPPAYRNP